MKQFEDIFPPNYFWSFGCGKFQEYYDSSYVTSVYYAPLTHTLALINGAGSPTLTRATAMWVFDDEGKLVTVPASAAAFGGSRGVRNIIRTTEGIAGSAQWTVNTNGSKVDANLPTGLTGAVTYSCNTNATNYLAHQTSLTTVDAGVVAYKFLYTAGVSDGWVAVHIYNGGNAARFQINTSTHEVGVMYNFGSGYTAISHNVSESDDYPGWYVAEFVASVPAGVTVTINHRFVDNNSLTEAFTTVSGRTITIAYPQGEVVTGQEDQTPSDEYVSSGVLAAPYHGAGIDGLKYFTTNKDGTPIPPASLLGLATNHAAVTNTMLYCRDFTNVGWVKTNVTAAKTQTGLDNEANSCSLLTATANDATILQTITAAAAAGCTGFYVKRSVGTGTISITRDGGSTWTDITSLVNSSTFTKVKIENTSVTNPSVGFKISTSGDAIIVDGCINHLGTKIHYLPILTTSAAVTVNAQTLTYPKTSNIIDAGGTVMATVTMDDWTGVDGGVVGSTTLGLFATATGASAKDGTNTPTGAADTPSGTVDIGMKYTTDFMRTMSDAGFGTATDYTGTLATDLTNISIGSGITGYVKKVAIWQEVISDYEMRNMP